jgi:hypothetical protein
MSKRAKEAIQVRGFARFQMVDAETGKPLGRPSKWYKNTVVNLGFAYYVCGSIGAMSNSTQVTYMAIGTGTAPAATDTSLQGEVGARATTTNSVQSSKTLQTTTQFAGSTLTAFPVTIQNVALVNTSSGGTILSGTTYATSQWNSNQNVNATYQLRFSA